jgi:hypothetical protein
MESTITIQGKNTAYIERILDLPAFLDKKSHENPLVTGGHLRF